MNCSVCGAMIPVGQNACPNCGAPVQQVAQPMQPMGGYQQPVQPMQPMGGYQQPVQPMQPMGGYQQPVQPMGGYQQPMQPQQPMGGYQQQAGGYQQPMGQPGGAAPAFNKAALSGILDGGIMKLVGLIGAALIMLSPLLSWCYAKIEFWGEVEKDSLNMFGIADELDAGIFVLYGIIIMLAGALLVCNDVADLAQPLQVLKQKLSMIPYVELIIVGVVLLFFILAMANGDVNDVIEAADLMGKGTHGVGPVVCIIGMLGAAAPRVCKILNINI
ncbi:MAG: hypothetical protein IJX85_07210 [Lachnospiraceae bacterium]|nr:hypothetical protein [Lachnospiraceae bacterium]